MKIRSPAFAGRLFPLLIAASAAAHADDGVRASSRALCASADAADVREAIGGSPGAGDVVLDDPDMGISCMFVDTGNYNNGLSLLFHTSADLRAADGRWETAAEYFEEFTRKGEKVSGLGDAAAWTNIGFAALYVLRGDTVVRMTSANPAFGDTAARARFEALARKLVARMP